MYRRSDDALRVGHDAYMTQLLVIHFRIGNLEQDNGEHRNNAFHWDPLGRMLPLEEADFWFFHLLTWDGRDTVSLILFSTCFATAQVLKGSQTRWFLIWREGSVLAGMYSVHLCEYKPEEGRERVSKLVVMRQGNMTQGACYLFPGSGGNVELCQPSSNHLAESGPELRKLQLIPWNSHLSS